MRLQPEHAVKLIVMANRVPQETEVAFTRGLEQYLADRKKRGKPISAKEMTCFFDITGKYNRRVKQATWKLDHNTYVEAGLTSFSYWLVGMGVWRACCGGPPVDDAANYSDVVEVRRSKLSYLRKDECIRIELSLTKHDEDVTTCRRLFLKRCVASTVLAGRKMCLEVAAYELCKLLELNLVPRTRLLRYKGWTYSAQDSVDTTIFTPGPESQNVPSLQERLQHDPDWAAAMSELWVFDYIGSFGDRQSQNLFFNMPTHSLQAIDHESGFCHIVPAVPTDPTLFLSGGRLPPAYTPHMQAVLSKLRFEDCWLALRHFLSMDAIEAVWLRVRVVMADMQMKGTTLC